MRPGSRESACRQGGTAELFSDEGKEYEPTRPTKQAPDRLVELVIARASDYQQLIHLKALTQIGYRGL